MENISFYDVKINKGFWKKRINQMAEVTSKSVFQRFDDTGRIKAFECDLSNGIKPHFFWDSDVAKWIEGVSYLIHLGYRCESEKNTIEHIIDCIEKNRQKDGYFNIYHMIVEPDLKFKNRDHHELYCAGHLIEAAIAYFEATGKDRFLKLMCDYVDCIEKHFVIDKDASFITPGHEEIELALVKLYRLTKNDKYLMLSKFFVDNRGKTIEDDPNRANYKYNQSHLQPKDQRDAQGHAVRAVYLYSAMADLAKELNDEQLKEASESIFDDIITKKMYVTGGIGSSKNGEAFTIPYDLPNIIAYSESCAAIGLVYFASRMQKLELNSKYADTIERIIYNGFLSSISLDGKSFFYENPLEIIPYLKDRDVSQTYKNDFLPKEQRSEVFSCSCCPPNILRFISSIGDYIYSFDGSTMYINQFISSETTFNDNKSKVAIETSYPGNGIVKIKNYGPAQQYAIRVPYWCDSYKGKTKNGYAFFKLRNGEEKTFDFQMRLKFISANPKVTFDISRSAISYGPIIYCSESYDNGSNLRDLIIDSKSKLTIKRDKELGLNCLVLDAYRHKENDKLYYEKDDKYIKTKAKLIPYYAFANRGICEMQVWHFVK